MQEDSPGKDLFSVLVLIIIDETMWRTLKKSSSSMKDRENQSTVDSRHSNSKGLSETLRDIRTSTYQSWESEENNKLNNHI